MRPTKALAASLLSLTLLTAACSDDETDVNAGDDTHQAGDGAGTAVAPDGSGVEVPDRDPELVATISTLTPFVPITEDCTPADDVDPDGAVSSDDPPI